MTQSERRRFLIEELLDEHTEYKNMRIPAGEEEQKQLLRGLINIRFPGAVGSVLYFLS